MKELLKSGDRVRYKVPNSLPPGLVGTVLDVHELEDGPIAQVSWGTIFRATSMIPLHLLEVVPPESENNA